MRDFTGVSGAAGGNAQDTSSPATQITASVMNAIVHEIGNVITDPEGGGVPLDPADSTQLLAAIAQMIANAGSGQIVKAGIYDGAVVAGQTLYVTFAQPFEAGTNYAVSFGAINNTGAATRDNWMQLGPRSELGFYATVQGTVTGGNNTLDGFTWTATPYTQ